MLKDKMSIIYGINSIIWVLIFWCTFFRLTSAHRYKEYDFCQSDTYSGTCLAASKCTDLSNNMRDMGLENTDVGHCGFTVTEEMICCPEKTLEKEVIEYDHEKEKEATEHDDEEDIRNVGQQISFLPTFPKKKYVGDQCQFSGHKGICTEVSRCVDLPVEMKMLGLGQNDVVRCGFTPYEEIICCPSSSAITSSSVQPQFGDYPAGKVGDQCQFSGHEGICTEASKCVDLPNEMKKLGLAQRDVVGCGFTAYEKIVCCPFTPKRHAQRFITRPAATACDEIDKGVQPTVTTHILGGRSVELGEYPHMVAIGLHNGPSIDYNCGGTLIAKRFVLTAAHCLVVEQQIPVKVRMGVVDFGSDDQMKHATEIKIKKSHVHPDYERGRHYNDIALLELESDAPYTANIYPTCLYTGANDLPKNEEYYVSGWGVTNNNKKSKILLKAKLTIVENKRCNASYVEGGLDRRIPSGVIGTQLCAHDVDRKRDACQGDSGGPLIMEVDKASGKFRVVGVISVGVSCGTSLPGIYTRVSAFLDFIESIVWPDGIVN